MELPTAQRNSRRMFVLCVALVLRMRRQEGYVSCAGMLSAEGKMAFFAFFFKCIIMKWTLVAFDHKSTS